MDSKTLKQVLNWAFYDVKNYTFLENKYLHLVFYIYRKKHPKTLNRNRCYTRALKSSLKDPGVLYMQQ